MIYNPVIIGIFTYETPIITLLYPYNKPIIWNGISKPIVNL